ncbi:MAG: ribonuclease Z [Methanoregulaceae archaeon]|jgi:ribonuclease BN (tRNA processing enzyme)|nr:ribonuclease Z [Methanoregulaceae archaeon]
MNVTFLGTNGWYDTLTGNTCSVLVQSGDYNIIFDAGNGLAKADRYINQEKPTFLFLSHYHLDHVIGLHTLTKFRFKNPLQICGQTGIEAILRSLVRDPFTVPFEELPFPVRFMELGEGSHTVPFPVECRSLVHPVPCYGYAITLDGRKIAYCTDTGFCENAVILSRNADLAITECGLRPGEESPDWPHLNPELAIRIANNAHAKRLALIHFAAHTYTSLRDRSRVEKTYRKEFPGLIAARDGLTVVV